MGLVIPKPFLKRSARANVLDSALGTSRQINDVFGRTCKSMADKILLASSKTFKLVGFKQGIRTEITPAVRTFKTA